MTIIYLTSSWPSFWAFLILPGNYEPLWTTQAREAEELVRTTCISCTHAVNMLHAPHINTHHSAIQQRVQLAKPDASAHFAAPLPMTNATELWTRKKHRAKAMYACFNIQVSPHGNTKQMLLIKISSNHVETLGILQIEVNMAFLEISYNHLIFRAQACQRCSGHLYSDIYDVAIPLWMTIGKLEYKPSPFPYFQVYLLSQSGNGCDAFV